MIHVCALADLPRGSARRLPLSPPVSVFHTADGELYAIDDTCTHQDASLADGWLEGCEVECPLHAAIFDLRTGEPDGLLAREPVRTHTVVLDGGSVHVVLTGAHPADVTPSLALPADAPLIGDAAPLDAAPLDAASLEAAS